MAKQPNKKPKAQHKTDGNPKEKKPNGKTIARGVKPMPEPFNLNKYIVDHWAYSTLWGIGFALIIGGIMALRGVKPIWCICAGMIIVLDMGLCLAFGKIDAWMNGGDSVNVPLASEHSESATISKPNATPAATRPEPEAIKPPFTFRSSKLNVSLGEHGIVVVWDLDDNGDLPLAPVIPFMVPYPLKISVNNWVPSIDCSFNDGKHLVRLKGSNLIGAESLGWQQNGDKDAIEIVDEKGRPVFQMVNKSANEITISGLFSADGQNAELVAGGMTFIVNIDGWKGLEGKLHALQPIFKYPYKGNEGVRIVRPQRHLTDLQKIELGKAIAHCAGTKIRVICELGHPETENFARDFVSVFEGEKLSCGFDPLIDEEGSHFGVVVYLNPKSTPETFELAKTFTNWFLENRPQDIGGPDNNLGLLTESMPPDQFTIRVLDEKPK